MNLRTENQENTSGRGLVGGSLASILNLTKSRLWGAVGDHGFDVESAHQPPCRHAASRLLHEHSELAGQVHMLSRDAWRVFWGPGRRAFLPFHEGSFSLITWRDPVGEQEARAEVVGLFRDYAARLGKHALMLGLSEQATASARAEGYRSFWLGAEQIFDFPTFTTKGKKGEKIRLATNHARRVGLRSREIFPQRDSKDRDLMLATDWAWKVDRPKRDVRSFLRTDPMENASMRRYFAVEHSDRPRAAESFVVCSPVSWRGWYLQDLVRHPDAPRGATELATLTAIEQLRESGAEFVTAGIVPMLKPDRVAQMGPPSALASWVVRHFDRLFRFSGLKQFRSKFPATRAEPIYIAYWPEVLTPMVFWDIAHTLG
jgi:phosphatidylglycerol lysyltransferase